MGTNHNTGHSGERDVVKRIACPNCGRKLMLLPPSYPLYDVQCTGCLFRAQVKTSNRRPGNAVFGATWDIMEKSLRAGHTVPPLIVNFTWQEKGKRCQEIHLYPFIIPRENLQKRYTEIKKSGRKLWMFNYVNLRSLPRFVLYKK